MVGQLQVAGVGVPQPLDAVVADADVMGCPLLAELGAERGEFADEFPQGPVVGLSSGLGTQQGDGGVAGGLPVDEEVPGDGVEEVWADSAEPDGVRRCRGQLAADRSVCGAASWVAAQVARRRSPSWEGEPGSAV